MVRGKKNARYHIEVDSRAYKNLFNEIDGYLTYQQFRPGVTFCIKVLPNGRLMVVTNGWRD